MAGAGGPPGPRQRRAAAVQQRPGLGGAHHRPGDRAAQAFIWRTHAPTVARLIRRTFGPDADVDDLVQDTLVAVFRDLPGLRDPGALGAFITSVTMNRIRKEMRRRRLRRFVSLTRTGELPDLADAGTVDRDGGARAAVRRLFHILESFRGQDRLIFLLRHVEGQSVSEVAEALGISVATVKRRSAHVLDRLSARIKADPLLAPYAAGWRSP